MPVLRLRPEVRKLQRVRMVEMTHCAGLTSGADCTGSSRAFEREHFVGGKTLSQRHLLDRETCLLLELSIGDDGVRVASNLGVLARATEEIHYGVESVLRCGAG